MEGLKECLECYDLRCQTFRNEADVIDFLRSRESRKIVHPINNIRKYGKVTLYWCRKNLKGWTTPVIALHHKLGIGPVELQKKLKEF